MNWEDKDIDGLFQKAAGQQKAAYKSEYWAEMEAMLGTPKTRKVAAWWWMTPLLLVGLSGAAWWMMDWNKNTILAVDTEVAQTAEQTTSRVVNSVQSESHSENSQTIAEENKKVNEGPAQEAISAKPSKNPATAQFSGDHSAVVENGFRNQSTAPRVSDKPQIVPAVQSKDVQAASIKESTTKPTATFKMAIEQTKEVMPKRAMEANPEVGVGEMPLRPAFVGDIQRHDMLKLGVPIRPYRMFMDIGLLASQGYRLTKETSWQYGAGLHLGVEYATRDWQFSGALGALYMKSKTVEYLDARELYSYGKVVQQSNFSYTDFVYMNAAFGVSRRWSKSSLGALIEPRLLLGTKVAVSQNTASCLANQQIGATNSTRDAFVRSEHIQPFTLNAGLVYSFNLTPTVSMQAKASYGIINPLRKSEFQGEQNSWPFEFGLGLRKYF